MLRAVLLDIASRVRSLHNFALIIGMNAVIRLDEALRNSAKYRLTRHRGYVRLCVFYAFLIQLKNWLNMNEILIGNISHFGSIDGFRYVLLLLLLFFIPEEF